jgi:hypothetical protein
VDAREAYGSQSPHKSAGIAPVGSGVLRALSMCVPVPLDASPTLAQVFEPGCSRSTFLRSPLRARLKHSPARPGYSSSMSRVSCVTRDCTLLLRERVSMKTQQIASFLHLAD